MYICKYVYVYEHMFSYIYIYILALSVVANLSKRFSMVPFRTEVYI